MVYICALPTSSTTVLDVSAPGPLSSTVSCMCFTQCTSCKSLFSFSLLGHYYCCNIRSLTQLLNESLRETTSAPLLRVLNCFHRIASSESTTDGIHLCFT